MDVTNLENVKESLFVEDFNFNYFYQRVFDPDNKPTKYFNLFYKDQQNSNWLTKNGLLTNEFTVVKSEDILHKIQKDLNLNPDSQNFQYFQIGCSIKCDFIMSYNFNSDLVEITDADKILFNLLTGVSVDDLNFDNGITFELINGMGGNHSLQLSYGFLQKLESKQSQTLHTNNLFVLDEFRKKLKHDDKMLVSYEEINKVKENIDNCLNKLFNIQATPKFIEALKSVITKRTIKQFMEIFNEIPEKQQNLYYVTQVLSHIFSQRSDLAQELRARNFISGWIKNSNQ